MQTCASKFILGQRMYKLTIIGSTEATIYTEPYTTVFCFVVQLEISQAWGCIWKASFLFCDDVKVVFPGLMHLAWIWSLQLDCVSKMLSPLFQWNPDYVLKMVASRNRFSIHLERTLQSWYLCWLACMLVLNIPDLGLLDHFSNLGLNLQIFVNCYQKWDTEVCDVWCLHASKPVVL